jgi:hypothetical protein
VEILTVVLALLATLLVPAIVLEVRARRPRPGSDGPGVQVPERTVHRP